MKGRITYNIFLYEKQTFPMFVLNCNRLTATLPQTFQPARSCTNHVMRNMLLQSKLYS